MPDGAHDHAYATPEHIHSLPEHTHPLEVHDHPLPEHSHAYAALDHVHADVAAHDHPHNHEPQLDGAIIVAAADWPWKSGAHFVCDGINDEEQFRLAHDALPASGGKIVATGGAFRPYDQISITKDNAWLTGFGAATVFAPDASFPADKYVFSVYRDERSPVARAQLSQFAIRGHGITYANPIHGVEFVTYRGHMDHIWINQLPGTGLRVHNVAGGDGSGWNCYEATYSHLNIGGCNIGVDANSTDQHWSDLQVYSNVECNLKGNYTGTMFNNCHFYGGTQNRPQTQTLVNLDLYTCSRMSMEGGKVEHAARELIVLNNNGHLRLSNVGLRNGSGEGENLHPQIRVKRRAPNGVWGLTVVGCRFDADVGKPSWNILIEPDALRGAIIEATKFSNGQQGSVTPFGARIGVRSTLNGLGWNQTDPNLGGDWIGYGEWGTQVVAADTGQKWEARSRTLWVPA